MKQNTVYGKSDSHLAGFGVSVWNKSCKRVLATRLTESRGVKSMCPIKLQIVAGEQPTGVN